MTRCPCLDPSNLRLMRAVALPAGTEDIAGDVVMFSTQGDQPDVALMGSGDYDGDSYFVIVHPVMVAEFKVRLLRSLRSALNPSTQYNPNPNPNPTLQARLQGRAPEGACFGPCGAEPMEAGADEEDSQQQEEEEEGHEDEGNVAEDEDKWENSEMGMLESIRHVVRKRVKQDEVHMDKCRTATMHNTLCALRGNQLLDQEPPGDVKDVLFHSGPRALARRHT